MKTEAQKRATAKYDKKAYYRPTIYLRRELTEALQAKADASGKTISAYILNLIKKDLGIEESEVKTMYVAARENGDFIERVNSIDNGKKLISKFEESDKAEGIYEENFYDIVDDEHNSVL